jgi:uncharacterized protein YjbK
MLETELKCIITENIYEKIKGEFDWNSAAEQINHYYTDEESELRRKRIMVRVREKNGKHKLQIKLHKNADSPLQICEETEVDIDAVPKNIKSDIIKKAVGIDCGDLMYMGSSATLRHSLMWNKDTEICLDRTTYFNETDYEIEIEYVGEADKKLLDELSKMGVSFDKNSVGKFSRFLNKYDKIKNIN